MRALDCQLVHTDNVGSCRFVCVSSQGHGHQSWPGKRVGRASRHTFCKGPRLRKIKPPTHRTHRTHHGMSLSATKESERPIADPLTHGISSCSLPCHLNHTVTTTSFYNRDNPESDEPHSSRYRPAFSISNMIVFLVHQSTT